MQRIGRHFWNSRVTLWTGRPESAFHSLFNFVSLRTIGYLPAILLLIVVSTLFTRAQGTLNFVTLQTGGDVPLVSNQEVLSYDGSAGSILTFDFGFFSNEQPSPGAFLDSFTITLQDSSSSTAVLGTIDASGVLWAPPTLGGIPLSDSDLIRSLVSPPDGAPVSGRGIGYAISLILPANLSGPNLTLYFDLFDNQDSNQSLGWYTAPQITAVPEPEFSILFTSALLGWFIRRKRLHAVQKP